MMSKLAVLVDPSEDCTKMINYINDNWEKMQIDVWIGCSSDNGKKTYDMLNSLEIPLENKILFPGRLFQGIRGGKDVGYILRPYVLGNHTSKRRSLCNIISKIGGYIVSHAFSSKDTKMLDFGYLVLNGETSSVGRRVGAKDISDIDAINIVEVYTKTKNFDFIYVEGGSGSIESIAERVSLLYVLKSLIGEKKLIVGGGITTEEQFKQVSEIADCVVVGTAFEKDPDLISKFYNNLR